MNWERSQFPGTENLIQGAASTGRLIFLSINSLEVCLAMAGSESQPFSSLYSQKMAAPAPSIRSACETGRRKGAAPCLRRLSPSSETSGGCQGAPANSWGLLTRTVSCGCPQGQGPWEWVSSFPVSQVGSGKGEKVGISVRSVNKECLPLLISGW